MRSLALALVLVLVPVLARATPLLGVTFGLDAPPSVLYNLDSSTGRAANPRPLEVDPMDPPLDGITGLEIASDGTLYGLTTWSLDDTEENPVPNRNTLVTIDPATGIATPVNDTSHNTGLDRIVEGDLAFDPVSGDLYGIGSNRGPADGNMLFTLDLATGLATELGGLPWTFNIPALSFDAQGNLYAIELMGSNLLQLDPSNGSEISRTSLSAPLQGNVAGMDLDPLSGVFFVADGDSQNGAPFELYTLDPTSATLTLTSVGELGLGLGLSGLAVVPEPSSVLLLAGGLAALSFTRRRR